jgi:hypothetical protein
LTFHFFLRSKIIDLQSDPDRNLSTRQEVLAIWVASERSIWSEAAVLWSDREKISGKINDAVVDLSSEMADAANSGYPTD